MSVKDILNEALWEVHSNILFSMQFISLHFICIYFRFFSSYAIQFSYISISQIPDVINYI